MLSRSGRVVTNAVFTPVAKLLLRWHVSPDVVTIFGTVAVVTAALWLFPTGHLLAGALVIAFFALTDSIDGIMARTAGRSSAWGAFLDSTLDRFGDAAIFSGLVLWFMGDGDSTWGAGLALACLVLGAIVSYARARAEGLGMTASVGIAERADRLVTVLVATIIVGAGAPQMILVVVLGILALASFVTVIQRILHVRKQAMAMGAAEPPAAA